MLKWYKFWLSLAIITTLHSWAMEDEEDLFTTGTSYQEHEESESDPEQGKKKDLEKDYMDKLIEEQRERRGAPKRQRFAKKILNNTPLPANIDELNEEEIRKFIEIKSKELAESDEYLATIEKKRNERAERRRLRKLRRSANKNQIDTSLMKRITIKEQHSFLSNLSCEKVCLGFLGIIVILKIWFNYYTQSSEEKIACDTRLN